MAELRVAGLRRSQSYGGNANFLADFWKFMGTGQPVEDLNAVKTTKGILAGRSDTLEIDVLTEEMGHDGLGYIDVTIDQKAYPKGTSVRVDYNGKTKDVSPHKARLQDAFDTGLRALHKLVKAVEGKAVRSRTPRRSRSRTPQRPRSLTPKAKTTKGKSGSAQLSVEAEVMDFYTVLFAAALGAPSNRINEIIKPWPLVRVGGKVVVDDKAKSVSEVSAVLGRLGCAEERARALEDGRLDEVLGKKDKAGPGLLRWLADSSPSEWTRLDGKEQLGWLSTPHQFFLVSEAPAKEKAFRAAAKQYGTAFAFHGSSLHNWHAIVRGGLKNYLGTPMMANAAAHGNGIYLSQNSGLSVSYSSMGVWLGGMGMVGSGAGSGVGSGVGSGRAGKCSLRKAHSCDGAGQWLGEPGKWLALGLVEVALSPQLNRSTSMIWTMPKDEHCAVRVLALYPLHSQGPGLNLAHSHYADVQRLSKQLRP